MPTLSLLMGSLLLLCMLYTEYQTPQQYCFTQQDVQLLQSYDDYNILYYENLNITSRMDLIVDCINNVYLEGRENE